VPIVVLTFWGKGYNGYTLRRLVAQVDDEVRKIPDISETTIKGGLRRQLRVLLDPAKMASVGVDPVDVLQVIPQNNQAVVAGEFAHKNREFSVKLNSFISSAHDVKSLVVKVVKGRPVHLGEIAKVIDGPQEPDSYVLFGAGPAAEEKG